MRAQGRQGLPARAWHGRATIPGVARKPTAEELHAALRELMRVLALKGASKGGHARAAALTPWQRRASARKAARARWAKKRV
jgi:hypothetical protein